MNDGRHPMQRLEEQRRVLGASRVIRDGVSPEQVTAADRDAVLQRVGDYRTRRNLTWAAIAKGVGVHGSVMSALVNLHNPPRWQSIVMDIDRWLEDRIKSEESGNVTAFVPTRVAQEVFTVANAAIHLQSIGLIWGWSGLGKTMALKAIAAEKPGCLFVSIRTADATPIGVARAIATAAKLRDTASMALSGIVRRLEESLEGTNRLIIIDEIHKLCGSQDDRPLHVLRDLFDATQCPQLWSGTTDLIGYLDRRVAAGKEPLAQIRRRIGICRDLTARCQGGGGGHDGGGESEGEPLFSVDEIRQMFAAGKMRLTPEAIRYLYLLANLPDSGGIGTCCNLVTMATKVNGQTADTLTADMLRGVHRLLLSTRDFSLLQERMRDTTSPRSVVKVG